MMLVQDCIKGLGAGGGGWILDFKMSKILVLKILRFLSCSWNNNGATKKGNLECKSGSK